LFKIQKKIGDILNRVGEQQSGYGFNFFHVSFSTSRNS
jgi:hypothetical protein